MVLLGCFSHITGVANRWTLHAGGTVLDAAPLPLLNQLTENWFSFQVMSADLTLMLSFSNLFDADVVDESWMQN